MEACVVCYYADTAIPETRYFGEHKGDAEKTDVAAAYRYFFEQKHGLQGEEKQLRSVDFMMRWVGIEGSPVMYPNPEAKKSPPFQTMGRISGDTKEAFDHAMEVMQERIQKELQNFEGGRNFRVAISDVVQGETGFSSPQYTTFATCDEALAYYSSRIVEFNIKALHLVSFQVKHYGEVLAINRGRDGKQELRLSGPSSPEFYDFAHVKRTN
jgi:hypothetical protein